MSCDRVRRFETLMLVAVGDEIIPEEGILEAVVRIQRIKMLVSCLYLEVVC
jgi:hypothetical protein